MRLSWFGSTEAWQPPDSHWPARGGLAGGGRGAFARRYATSIHLLVRVRQQLIRIFLVLCGTDSVDLHSAQNAIDRVRRCTVQIC